MLRFEQNSLFGSPNADSLFINKEKNTKGKSLQRSSGRWTKEEHQKFVEGLKKFGKNWKYIEEYVGTRNGAQIRSHAQKYFNRLGKDGLSNFEVKDDKPVKATEEIIRKTSGSSLDTNCSDQDHENRSTKLSQPVSPFLEEKLKIELESPDLVSVSLLHNENKNCLKSADLNQKLAQNRGIDHSQALSSSLFDLLISRMKACNNQIVVPRLSDFVNVSTSENGFAFADLKQTKRNGLFSNSFKLHQSSIPGENSIMMGKLNKLRHPNQVDLTENDLPTKKVKVN